MRMIKFIFALAILGVSAYGMMHIKQQVQNRTKDLLEVKRQIAMDKEALHVLKAEWAYLNQPERIKRLADQHLGMRYTMAKQVAKSLEQGVGILGYHPVALAVKPTLKPTLSSLRR